WRPWVAPGGWVPARDQARDTARHPVLHCWVCVDGSGVSLHQPSSRVTTSVGSSVMRRYAPVARGQPTGLWFRGVRIGVSCMQERFTRFPRLGSALIFPLTLPPPAECRLQGGPAVTVSVGRQERRHDE